MSKMRKTTMLFTSILLIFSLLGIGMPLSAKAASKPTYTISPNTKPTNKKMLKFTTYNTYTKHYYLVRSYLEKLEKKGGGKLVLKKGTYTISNALYVPSNVTIEMQNGVKIVKGKKTGTRKFGASKSIFQLIRPSKAAKSGVYGKFNGEKNITFQGKGTVIFDMKYDKDCVGIIIGHNRNVKIRNIQFKNLYSGHFIELDASRNVDIRNNSFVGSKASANVNKEAINLDTPDKTTKGWSQKWSKYDKTANQIVTIENNRFKGLDRSIGTHKYSGGKYHDRVVLRNNKISSIRSDAIRVMNWSNSIIERNVIDHVAGGNSGKRGILVSGAKNPTIRNNTFHKVGRVIQFMPWKNSGPGSRYGITYNKLSSANKKALITNKATNISERFIRINNKYNEFTKYTQKIKLR
ncbi:right-handed parallel beta-helix repeat-containing protein [Bacillus changyiensis]|uniref:right-handed parallel beta-helix repeat-containing protein n=1 Tax=Bacillus changyiensis TaxID=3004103 RepID=UPI0022E7CA85|nr:right-handed parallel beta-helix repeat-containing protein [Bacillus changyiensis]MDA1476186.1 right-handed parallel beta-helix repeat-containing protein [Bacillus changyiensis]